MYSDGHETTDPLRIVPDETGRLYGTQLDEPLSNTTQPIPRWIRLRALLRGSGRHKGRRQTGTLRSLATAVTFAAVGFAAVTVVLSATPTPIAPARVPSSREQVTVTKTKPKPTPTRRRPIVISPVDVHTRTKPAMPASPKPVVPSPKPTTAPSPSPHPTPPPSPSGTAEPSPSVTAPTTDEASEAPEPGTPETDDSNARHPWWQQHRSGGEPQWLLAL